LCDTRQLSEETADDRIDCGPNQNRELSDGIKSLVNFDGANLHDLGVLIRATPAGLQSIFPSRALRVEDHNPPFNEVALASLPLAHRFSKQTNPGDVLLSQRESEAERPVPTCLPNDFTVGATRVTRIKFYSTPAKKFGDRSGPAADKGTKGHTTYG
jgi:hypothetical protein